MKRLMFRIVNRLNRYYLNMVVSIHRKLETIINNNWNNFPFGKVPYASIDEYMHKAKTTKKYKYPEIDKYEKQTGFSVDKKWLHDLALHTQIVIKESTLCYTHGRILYSALSNYVFKHQKTHLSTTRIVVYETGTARGFSALCMAKALHDRKQVGTIITFDLLPHTVPMYWNCIDDWNFGPLTRSELLSKWADLIKDHIIFHQGDTYLELSKVQTERVHFAFLDGVHDFDAIMHEFENIEDKQKNGDIIVFDDYNPLQYSSLVRAIDEICLSGQYDCTKIGSMDRGYVIAKKL